MGQVAELIVTCGRRARTFGEKLLAGVQPGQFARKPRADGKVIDTNHPAFVYGHLSLYPARILGFLKLDPAPAAVPVAWVQLFNPGTPCHDDPDGRIYPPMAELTAAYCRTYDAVLAALPGVSDAALAAPTPDERYRAFLPVVGAAALSMLNNHPALHFGQISAWRRCMGLGPVQ